MTQQKTYAPGNCKLRTNCQWFELSYGFKADDMIEFIRANKNAKGFVNLRITERKSAGKYGETHSVSLDTWEPKASGQQSQQGFQAMKQAVDEAGGQSDAVPF